jgi:hypothetical protein
MATYHFSAKVIGRGSRRTKRLPQSAVGAAAYRAGARLTDERTGVTYDFRRKRSVVGGGILTPTGAPAWACEREALWNRVERRETRSDAVTAREIEFSLPRELSPQQREDLARTFLDEQFVRRGMVVDFALHDPLARDKLGQGHCHALLTKRPFVNGEFGSKERSWDARALLRTWRAEWAKAANAALIEAGHPHAANLDHRSNSERGLVALPTIHEGRRAPGDRSRINAIIHQRNSIRAEVATLDAEIALLGARLAGLVMRREEARIRLADVSDRRRLKLETESHASEDHDVLVPVPQPSDTQAIIRAKTKPASNFRKAAPRECASAAMSPVNRIAFFGGDRRTVLLALREKDVMEFRQLQADRGESISAALIIGEAAVNRGLRSLQLELRSCANSALLGASKVIALEPDPGCGILTRAWPKATPRRPRTGCTDWAQERQVAFDELRSALFAAGREWVGLNGEMRGSLEGDPKLQEEMADLRARLVSVGQAASQAIRLRDFREAAQLTDRVWQEVQDLRTWWTDFDVGDSDLRPGTGA